MEDIRQVADDKFAAEVDKLVRFAEDTRLQKSKQYDLRRRISFALTLIVVTGASSWFLWLLLMGGDMRMAWISLASLVFLPLLSYTWTRQPLVAYRKEFKTYLMPRMAKLLGSLHFHPSGGISLKAVGASRIIPAHKIYKAEDAFTGIYKGTKILISEARLYMKKGRDPIFSGVFVLLMTPKGKFRGHTIVSGDDEMIRRYHATRWKGLSQVPFREGVKGSGYHVFSDNPEEAVTLADEDFMELLHTLNQLFDGSKITACFFKGNRVFMMIPYEDDMFEPGDINMPITNRNHALKCKREIEQILHVVDVLDVYEADSAKPKESQPMEPAEKSEASPGNPPLPAGEGGAREAGG